MKHELKFWEGIANVSNPGWNIRITRDLTQEAPGLSTNDSLVYVVDVASWWLAAGAMSSLDGHETMAKLRAFLAKQGDPSAQSRTASDLAGNLISGCGAQNAASDNSIVGLSIAVAAASLSETQTYAMARATNEQAKLAPLSGHWLCLAYTTANGVDIYTRPVWLSHARFASGTGPAFMHPTQLMGFVRQVVQQDTTNPKLSIYRQLKDSGGALVAPELR